jgi:hypothetical protein
MGSCVCPIKSFKSNVPHAQTWACHGERYPCWMSGSCSGRVSAAAPAVDVVVAAAVAAAAVGCAKVFSKVFSRHRSLPLFSSRGGVFDAAGGGHRRCRRGEQRGSGGWRRTHGTHATSCNCGAAQQCNGVGRGIVEAFSGGCAALGGDCALNAGLDVIYSFMLMWFAYFYLPTKHEARAHRVVVVMVVVVVVVVVVVI